MDENEQQLSHVFAPLPESPAIYTSDEFVFRFPSRLTLPAQCVELLDARHFVARSSVILGQLGLDNDLRVEFAWNMFGLLIQVPKHRGNATQFIVNPACNVTDFFGNWYVRVPVIALVPYGKAYHMSVSDTSPVTRRRLHIAHLQIVHVFSHKIRNLFSLDPRCQRAMLFA